MNSDGRPQSELMKIAVTLTAIAARVPDRPAIVQGWAGVYSSFLLHAERASERYGVPAHEILQRAGELGYVGGQEDMIIDIAVGLAQEREPKAVVMEV